MAMEPEISKTALVQSINFHGQNLHKLCESQPQLQEVLSKANPQTINYKEFTARQKYLSFQDRGKRLRIQEFIAKHAGTFFDEKFVAPLPEARLKPAVDETFFAAIPPFEAFSNADRESKIRRFFETTNVGDTLLCQVFNKQAVYGVKVLIVEGEKPMVVADLGIKAVLQMNQVVGQRQLIVGDNVRVTVIEIVPSSDKLIISDAVPYTEPLPAIYKKVMTDAKNEKYDDLLHKDAGFSNPANISYLASLIGLGSDHHSNMLNLRSEFPQDEYAQDLRQQQAAKWAFKSVADGIEHFKGGRHSEAFQCLNKALSIDPRNVEGLVARGALYANSGSFKKAIDDFEMALKVNPTHGNARKYMGETLVALGRSHEEKNEMDDALKAYEHCLILLPYHEEARNSIEYLRSKNLVPPLDISAGGGDEKKPKKEKKKKGKKRRHASTSGSSSSSSSSSSDSSSESSSDSSSSGSSHSSRAKKKKRKNKKERKEKSLSPLSKRMQLMEGGLELEGSQRNQTNPAAFSKVPSDYTKSEYEMRVRAFIEQTKGTSDYEDQVRKFLAEADRLKPDRKSTEEKEKKKKKKDKKDRKEKNKKRKREEREEKKRRKRGKKDKNYPDDDEEEEEKLREAMRKEMSMKQELRRRVVAHEATETQVQAVKLGGYFYKPKEPSLQKEERNFDDRMRGALERTRSSPKAYRKVEASPEEKGIVVNKNVDIFERSPPQKQNKIQIGPIMGASRYAPKKEREEKLWDGAALKQKPKTPPLPPEPIKTIVDKFSFRVKVLDPPAEKPRKRSVSSGSSGSRARRRSSDSRRSASFNSRSRSRSMGSRSRSRSRSRSPRSRSRSYDRYSRSRSRSPRRYMQRFRGNQRGTYYKPRFQHQLPFRPMRGRDNYMRGNRGNYNNHYNRYDNRYDRGRNRGFVPRGHMRGMRRPFYRGGQQGQYYDRRRYYDDDRRRSRDRSRSESYEEEDTMRRVGAVKDKIDKHIETSGKEDREPRSDGHTHGNEPLSEGEAPDSPPAANGLKD